MDRIWLKSYPDGVPADVDLGKLRTLAQLIDEGVTRRADSAAYVQMGRSLTYREVDELSRRFAAYLQKTARLAKGDRFAIMLPNVLQYPIAMFAALRNGLAVVNTNPLYTAPELEHQLMDSGATAILVLENFAHVVEKVLPRTQLKHVFVTAVGDLLGFPKSAIVNYVVRKRRKQVRPWHIYGAVSFKSALSEGRRLKFDPVDVRPEALAYLQYTGGTTGVAKGAMLTHTNISANILQAEAWVAPHFKEKAGTLITPIPLYHIFALTANC